MPTTNLQHLLNNHFRLYVVATGAGAGIQQALWSVPGCSSFLVGASFPYDPRQTEEFLGFKPEKSFCSAETAIDLSMAAYMRACGEDLLLDKQSIGLGLTASVATLKSHRGEHRVYASVTTKDKVWLSELILPKPSTDEQDISAIRIRDGNLADELGLNLLYSVLDIQTDSNKEDVTDLARTRFFMHPFFDNDGGRRYEGAPKGHKILFPGAFNPPHAGHFFNAKNAGGNDTIFNITANPPHKEELTLGEMLQRACFLKGHKVLFTRDDPYYLDKAKNFPGCNFVIGADALIRLLDQKWYDRPVRDILVEFNRLGTIFLVGERNGEGLEKIIMDGRLPRYHSNIFSSLPTSPYSNLSSTQIREERLIK
jgi:nicotinic acid mononucleotide adenylyltransferase